MESESAAAADSQHRYEGKENHQIKAVSGSWPVFTNQRTDDVSLCMTICRANNATTRLPALISYWAIDSWPVIDGSSASGSLAEANAGPLEDDKPDAPAGARDV